MSGDDLRALGEKFMQLGARSLCHDDGACAAMQQAVIINKAVQAAGSAGFSSWPETRKRAGKAAVAFMLAAVTTGFCPSCKRRVR